MRRQLLLAALFPFLLLRAEKTLKLADLPEPVRRTVEAQINGAQIRNISKEKENGKLTYEVESARADGKTRDFVVDAAGALLVVEEEVDLTSLPAAARAAIEKRAAGSVITKVEALTKGSTTSYEAIVTKGRKKSEFVVSADGAPVK